LGVTPFSPYVHMSFIVSPYHAVPCTGDFLVGIVESQQAKTLGRSRRII